MSFCLGLDVDESFTLTAYKWLEWLNAVCGTQRSLGDCNYDYRLNLYFPECESFGVDPFSFWKNVGLYETAQPMEGAVEVLRKWKEAGNNIVVISYCKSMHMSSKVKFIKRWLPFLEFDKGDGFIATKEKGCIGNAIDIMIDDRLKYLNMFPKSAVKVLFNSPYKQEVEPKDSYMLANNWKDVGEILDSFLKEGLDVLG